MMSDKGIMLTGRNEVSDYFITPSEFEYKVKNEGEDLFDDKNVVLIGLVLVL